MIGWRPMTAHSCHGSERIRAPWTSLSLWGHWSLEWALGSLSLARRLLQSVRAIASVIVLLLCLSVANHWVFEISFSLFWFWFPSLGRLALYCFSTSTKSLQYPQREKVKRESLECSCNFVTKSCDQHERGRHLLCELWWNSCYCPHALAG